MRRFAIALLALVVAATAAASDLARERRIRDQIQGAVRVGQATTLRTGTTDFLAIDTPAETPTARGAVILLPGRGANPDWVDVIRPLRTGLPAHGWETLSLQMPVAAAGADAAAYRALIPEAFPRIAFAVDLLAKRGVRRVVILGHGLGALMAVEWLAKDRPPKVVKALVTVGLSADLKGSGSGALGALAGIHLPVLDIFGSDDLPAVRGTARARLAAARRAGNHKYRQVQVEGADHFFHDQDDELVGRVRAWIARVTGTSARAR